MRSETACRRFPRPNVHHNASTGEAYIVLVAVVWCVFRLWGLDRYDLGDGQRDTPCRELGEVFRGRHPFGRCQAGAALLQVIEPEVRRAVHGRLILAR